MNSLNQELLEFVIESDCDGAAVAVIDFKSQTFDFYEYLDGDLETRNENSRIYFDLASLSKPLINSFTYISQSLSDSNLNLLLNHRGGIPSWGLLSHKTWEEQVSSYPITESETVYSDFSALRFMLEAKKEIKENFQESVFKNLDKDIHFWKELPENLLTLQNGFYHSKPNIGKVHDPNAFNLNCFVSHAGLFGTIDGLARTLLAFDKNFDLLNLVKKQIEAEKNQNRFVLGFDTVSDTENTLAGAGCSKNTFGHLGFTGTSFWIDPDIKKGHIILSNSTKYYWFNKTRLNEFRRLVGKSVWL